MMRCYLLRHDHIVDFFTLHEGCDEDAVLIAEVAFSTRRDSEPDLDGFEIWDQGRLVYSYRTTVSLIRPNRAA